MIEWFVKTVDLSVNFDKLVAMLVAEGIPFETGELHGGKDIKIPNREAWTNKEDKAISVVCHPYSYGGDAGLLEIYVPSLNEGVEGFLDAEYTLEYIKDSLKGISRGSIG